MASQFDVIFEVFYEGHKGIYEVVTYLVDDNFDRELTILQAMCAMETLLDNIEEWERPSYRLYASGIVEPDE